MNHCFRRGFIVPLATTRRAAGGRVQSLLWSKTNALHSVGSAGGRWSSTTANATTTSTKNDDATLFPPPPTGGVVLASPLLRPFSSSSSRFFLLPRAQYPPANAYSALLQQSRSFASKKNKKKKGGGGGDNGKKLKLRVCYADYDLANDPDDSDDDELVQVPAKASLPDIARRVGEQYGLDADDVDSDSLEYHHNGEWKPLTDPQALQSGGQGGIVNVRFADMYEDESGNYNEDEYDYENEGDDYGAGDDDDDDAMFGGTLAENIRDMVKDLKDDGYAPSGNEGQMVSNKDGSSILMSTEEWVMEQAETDPELQSILLSKPGALAHIVQSLHFGFLWKKDEKDESTTTAAAAVED